MKKLLSFILLLLVFLSSCRPEREVTSNVSYLSLVISLFVVYCFDTIAFFIDYFIGELPRGIVVLPSAIFLVVLVVAFLTYFSTGIKLFIGTL